MPIPACYRRFSDTIDLSGDFIAGQCRIRLFLYSESASCVAGAAYATVIAQFLSVVLCLIRIYRGFPILHVGREDFQFDREQL